MNIVELIQGVGVDNTKCQFLDNATHDLRWSQKDHITKITFGTDMQLTVDGKLMMGDTEMIGMVVWLPREAAMATSKRARGK